MHENPKVQLRPAAPSELHLLARIDDDAAALYEEAGLDLSGAPLHRFAEAERARWARAAQRGLAELAVDDQNEALGFIVLGYLDGLPYLDQISVARKWMRRGVGRALLARAIAWSESAGESKRAGPRASKTALWLTTYAHLPWNAPMYERAGFRRVDESRCGPELQQTLREQRAALPDPSQRIAMVR